MSAAAIKRLNKTAKVIADSDSDDDAPVIKKAKSSSKKHMRKRKQSESDDDQSVPQTSSHKSREATGYEELDAIQREEDQDIRERDELDKRIRANNLASQKKVMSSREAREKAEALRRLKVLSGSLKDQKDMVDKMRQESRKRYLPKRKEDKLYELKRAVEEDGKNFLPEELTETERKDLENKRKILEYAERFENAGKEVKQKRYHLPDASKKLIDEPEEERRVGDARRWEDEQLSSAMFKTGARDRKADELDLLLEDLKVDFTEAVTTGGDNEEKKPVLSAMEKKKLSLAETRKTLPVYSFREEFLEAVRENQVIIVVAETGSGKTTQLPQYLYEAGYCKDGKRIGCTQPRRVAAMSVATRVAEEVGTKLGHDVGYTIRFEDCTSEKTRIKYMTDGMLLRELLNEPDLGSYSVMMIDEAHERTLHTDILFGLVKDIAKFRPDLKLLISSATLDADKFSQFFDDANIFKIPGRRFPVDIFYTKAPEADPLKAAETTVLQIHLTQGLPGDILVFLTGQEEIESMEEALNERIKHLGKRIKQLIVVPVYANLPSELQQKIFEPTPPDARKVVLATNIAETSVTIDGIAYVIDPGFVKQNSYDSRSGVEHLQIVTVSKAAANQRAGRAGRTGPGKCFRLYTPYAYKNELDDQPIPEIQRTNLANVILMLLTLGIDDVVHFDYLDPPPNETVAAALEHLFALGALNHKGILTKLGRRMAEFPCDPAMSKMIVMAEKYQCTSEIISIAAMLSVNAAIFYRPKNQIIHADTARKGFWSPAGDHLTLLNVYERWKESDYSVQWCVDNFVQYRTLKRARDIRDQLEALLEKVEIAITSNDDPTPIRKAVSSGYFYNVAALDKTGAYKTVRNRHTVQIHPHSSLFEDRPRWVIYHQLMATTKEYMREVIQVESGWINEVAPHYYKSFNLDEMAKKKMPKSMGKSKSELQRD
ncbi:unnamed protein product [Bursaphelenchus okinawaensis]|uniref:RNA helicase n=1 Tax=Bursaphelenchus okinawaensis TaxID=465554 RepID=A0A811K4P4_9BILA|nr:unnamed protein product [Bursaphelenchus okinawaensis]CAG9092414.1 unnamed protein product [Bursaphelenchus okinawaensis]